MNARKLALLIASFSLFIAMEHPASCREFDEAYADMEDSPRELPVKKPSSRKRKREPAAINAPSRLAIGVYLTQNSPLFNSDAGSPGMAGMSTRRARGVVGGTSSAQGSSLDPNAFGLMESTTALSATGGYRLSDAVSLYLSAGTTIQRGITDRPWASDSCSFRLRT